jgi:hypothetical protein
VDLCADVDCDDGDLCTTDTCDSLTGECSNDAVECDAGTSCDADTGECVAIVCTADGDCDDGLYCNGSETCDLTDPDNGFCVDGTSPCTDAQTCDEDTDTCVDPTGEAFDLTSGTDTFTGDVGADTFDGQRDIVGGNFFQTLNNADSLNGGDGTDTLTGQFQGGGTTTPALLTSIEVYNLEVADTNNTTLSLANATGVTTINNTSSQADLTVQNLTEAPTIIGTTNVTQDFTVTVTTGLSGSSDMCTLNVSATVDGGTEPVITLQPSSAGSGYETVEVVSSGGVANSLDQLTDGNGNSLTTLNISGTQDLTIGDALDATVATINCSGTSGKTTLDATGATSNVTYTGGSGNDSLDISGTYTTSDTLDGGDGTDTLILTAAEAQVSTNQTNVSNFETIKTDTITSGNINLTYWNGATGLNLNAGVATGNTLTLPTGGTLTVGSVDPAGSNTIAVIADTTSDVLNLTLKNVTWTTNCSPTTFETVNISSSTGANVIGGTFVLTATAQNDTINLTGSQNMTFTGAITADTLDASAFTGVLTVTGGFADDVVITGGSGNDSLRGSTQADIITGGAGNDTIRGDDGSDTLTGGDGSDTFDGDNGDSDELLTITDTITDFNAGTSTTTVDSFVYDISSIEATTGVTDLVDTSANSSAGADGTYVLLSTDGASVANADVVGLIGDYADAAAALAAKTSWTITYGAALTDNDAFLVAYTSGTSVRIAVAIDNGGGATSDAIDTLFDIAILQNTSLSSLNSGDFTAQ